MELRNISQISNFTDDALTQYAHDISEEKNMSMTLVYNALDALRKFNVINPLKLYLHGSDSIAVYILRNAAAGKITINFDSAITDFCGSLENLILLPLLHNEDTLKVTSGTTSYVIINTTIYNELQESSADNFAHYRDRELSDYIDYTEHFKQHPEDLHTNTSIIRGLQYLQFLGLRDMTEEESKIIPENSSSITMDESTTRFSSALWFKAIQNKVIVLAGIGGIGSYIALLLARMKPKALFLYDDDEVETVNMAGQLYSINDVGKKKVDALADICSSFALYDSVFAIPEKFTLESEASDIMICGFDSMEARNLYYHKWLNHIKELDDDRQKHCLFLDGRLAAEEFQVFCITGDDTYSQELYRTKYLFDDEQADATVCSYKQTSYMANMIGSMIVNLFVNFVANEVGGMRDLPFLTSYEGESLMFETQQ